MGIKASHLTGNSNAFIYVDKAKLATRKTSDLCHIGPLVRGIHWKPVDYPHKGPVLWQLLWQLLWHWQVTYGFDYISMFWSQLNHVSKSIPRSLSFMVVTFAPFRICDWIFILIYLPLSEWGSVCWKCCCKWVIAVNHIIFQSSN